MDANPNSGPQTNQMTDPDLGNGSGTSGPDNNSLGTNSTFSLPPAAQELQLLLLAVPQRHSDGYHKASEVAEWKDKMEGVLVSQCHCIFKYIY
jgi:hypothetical protein